MQPDVPSPELQPASPTNSEVDGAELQRPAMAEVTPGPLVPAAPPLASHNVVPVADPASVATTDDPVVPQPITSPLSAADSDLIEPQWVDAVDTIVAQSGQNPRQEETEAEQLSQTYLKERFNIDVSKAE